MSGADPGSFLAGGALVSCSTSTPINHIVVFFAEYQLYWKTAGVRTSDVYLGKRLPCYYHFDWIFKFAVKWPSMCEKMVFLPKVQSV